MITGHVIDYDPFITNVLKSSLDSAAYNSVMIMFAELNIVSFDTFSSTAA